VRDLFAFIEYQISNGKCQIYMVNILRKARNRAIMTMQHPVPDTHLREIGDITVSFAMLEFSIKQLVWKLLNIDQRSGQIVTSGISFKTLIEMASSLYKENTSVQDPSFNELIREITGIEEQRNQITHSIWGAGKNAESITRIKTTSRLKKGLNHDFQEMTVSELKKIADSIKKLSHRIMMITYPT
jgi:hypothetical protein